MNIGKCLAGLLLVISGPSFGLLDQNLDREGKHYFRGEESSKYREVKEAIEKDLENTTLECKKDAGYSDMVEESVIKEEVIKFVTQKAAVVTIDKNLEQPVILVSAKGSYWDEKNFDKKKFSQVVAFTTDAMFKHILRFSFEIYDIKEVEYNHGDLINPDWRSKIETTISLMGSCLVIR